jgi:hypothetical protein
MIASKRFLRAVPTRERGMRGTTAIGTLCWNSQCTRRDEGNVGDENVERFHDAGVERC